VEDQNMSTDKPTAQRWTDLPADSPMALLERRRIVGQNAMVAQVSLQKGCKVPAHRHENEQFACVLSGRIRFGLGDEGSPEHERITLEGGGVLYLPPNVLHSAEALEDAVVLDVFSPPSETTGIDRAR